MSYKLHPYLTLILVAVTSSLHADIQAKPPTEKVLKVAESVVLQNGRCRYAVGLNGLNLNFGPTAGKVNLCVPDQPFMVVRTNGRTFASSKITLSGKIANIEFGQSGVLAKVLLEAKPDYLALTVLDVQGNGIEWLQLCNLRLTLAGTVGPLVNAAWDDRFAAAVMACNDRVDASGGDRAEAKLYARCYAEFGIAGARVAIIGVPTGMPDPGANLLDAIGRMEKAEGLPHPMVNGVWLKQSPERFRSYLRVNDLSENSVDEVIRAAMGGFGCIDFYPWSSTPSYRLNPVLFPHGLDGLKRVADKIHAAGMQVGIHVMQGMVGWGTKNDPYLVPSADPRLLQDRFGALAAAVDERATTFALQEGARDWPERGDLYVEGEIVRYTKRTATGFEDVQRGLYGTSIIPHAAGAKLGNLVNCFPNWGNTVYCPDLKTNIVDEISQRIADVFNAIGADMSYFDGGEELLKQPPAWHNQGTIATRVMKLLKRPVVLEGNACYTNLSWHVMTRGSPDFDPIYFGRREYTLRFKGTNPVKWAKNLLTGDVGWFAPHLHSPATDAVTPDEVMLLCLKALGGRSPISFSVAASDLQKIPRLAEMLEIIRAAEELKRLNYFSPGALEELMRPRAEFQLEQLTSGEWTLRPMTFGPPQVVNATSSQNGFDYRNPYEAQAPSMRVRARAKLASYGAPGNIVLADFAHNNPFQAEGTGDANLVQSLEPAAEKAPDGTAALIYRVENRGAAASSWTKIAYKLRKKIDLSSSRRLGLWVKSNGSGGILNVQLTGADARRDHYVPLDFTGWRLIELNSPEDARFWDYTWPYPWTDLFYTCWFIYQRTEELDLYTNGLPAGAKLECLIGRIEGLREIAAPLNSPTLEVDGEKLTFPVTLQPDEYVELDFTGRCRHFDPDGKELGSVKPVGSVLLRQNANKVGFSCALGDNVSSRAEITLAVRGKPLANAKNPAAKSTTARYEGLASSGRD